MMAGMYAQCTALVMQCLLLSSHIETALMSSPPSFFTLGGGKVRLGLNACHLSETRLRY